MKSYKDRTHLSTKLSNRSHLFFFTSANVGEDSSHHKLGQLLNTSLITGKPCQVSFINKGCLYIKEHIPRPTTTTTTEEKRLVK